MKFIALTTATLGLLALITTGWAETHSNLQAVTASGTSAWAGSHPFTLRGVILNNPEEMLDPAWDSGAEASGRMGGQWQLFIQATEAGDRGGTALWMGQNYPSLGPWIPAGNLYDEATWSNELQRINFEGAHRFRAGDLVEVTANKSLFFGGKRNVNEEHRTTHSNDFSIALVQAGFGLPDPEILVLSNLVSTGTSPIFDQTRQSGGEAYQGMRVRLEELRMATNYFGTNGWSKTTWDDRRCTVTDGQDRYLTLRMPRYEVGAMPSDWFSAVGIINQESGSGADGTFGYELFVQEVGPTLRSVATGGRVLVYWSGTYTNYTLEYTTNLTGEGWTNVTAPPAKWIAVEEDPAAEPRLYRLRQN